MLQLYNRVACLSSTRQRKRTQRAAAFCQSRATPSGAVLFYALLVTLSAMQKNNLFMPNAIDNVIAELFIIVANFEIVDIVFIFKFVAVDINE